MAGNTQIFLKNITIRYTDHVSADVLLPPLAVADRSANMEQRYISRILKYYLRIQIRRKKKAITTTQTTSLKKPTSKNSRSAWIPSSHLLLLLHQPTNPSQLTRPTISSLRSTAKLMSKSINWPQELTNPPSRSSPD